jgi:hypothetical protein
MNETVGGLFWSYFPSQPISGSSAALVSSSSADRSMFRRPTISPSLLTTSKILHCFNEGSPSFLLMWLWPLYSLCSSISLSHPESIHRDDAAIYILYSFHGTHLASNAGVSEHKGHRLGPIWLEREEPRDEYTRECDGGCDNKCDEHGLILAFDVSYDPDIPSQCDKIDRIHHRNLDLVKTYFAFWSRGLFPISKFPERFLTCVI